MDNEITIEWIEDDEGYDVRQHGEWIGDFFDLEAACVFALAVAENTGDSVVIMGVQSS